jgi:hypothetical protein
MVTTGPDSAPVSHGEPEADQLTSSRAKRSDGPERTYRRIGRARRSEDLEVVRPETPLLAPAFDDAAENGNGRPIPDGDDRGG